MRGTSPRTGCSGELHQADAAQLAAPAALAAAELAPSQFSALKRRSEERSSPGSGGRRPALTEDGDDVAHSPLRPINVALGGPSAGPVSDYEARLRGILSRPFRVPVPSGCIVRRTAAILSRCLPVERELVVSCRLAGCQLAMCGAFMQTDAVRRSLQADGSKGHGKSAQSALSATTSLGRLCSVQPPGPDPREGLGAGQRAATPAAALPGRTLHETCPSGAVR